MAIFNSYMLKYQRYPAIINDFFYLFATAAWSSQASRESLQSRQSRELIGMRREISVAIIVQSYGYPFTEKCWKITSTIFFTTVMLTCARRSEMICPIYDHDGPMFGIGVSNF